MACAVSTYAEFGTCRATIYLSSQSQTHSDRRRSLRDGETPHTDHRHIAVHLAWAQTHDLSNPVPRGESPQVC